MVWVGESVTLPEAFELVVTVRVDEPAVAVIVTDVALADCQFSVTVCPALIAPELAENTRSGGPPLLSPLQLESANKATGIAPQVTQRNNFVFISLVALPSPKARATFRCHFQFLSWQLSDKQNQRFSGGASTDE